MIKFFRRYQSLKKIYTQETQGIEHGKCYIFPKIDGSNAQTWFDGEQIMTGSRNRTLGETRETDNAGFCKAMRADKRINDFHKKYPNVRLYGEWLCLSGDTVIRLVSGGKRGNYMTLREMYQYSITPTIEKQKYQTKTGEVIKEYERQPWWERNGYPQLFSWFEDEDCIKPQRMAKIIYTGDKEVYLLTTRKGKQIKSTQDHKFLTNDGWKHLKDIKVGDVVATTDLSNYRPHRRYGKGTKDIQRMFSELKEKNVCAECGLSSCLEIHHVDCNWQNNDLDNLQVLCKDCHGKKHHNISALNQEYDYEFDKVISIEYVGVEDCYDISMGAPENSSSFVANNFIVHNCPHTIRTYRDDAWKKFYIFDVVVENNCEEETNDFRYLSYDEYKPMLDEFQLDYVVPLYIIDCPTKEQLIHAMNNNIFLLTDGAGVGEGIVIKNYSFVNRYGLVVWAKWVTSEFKEQHYKTMGVPEIQNNSIIEKAMIEAGINRTLIAKEYFKIIQAEGTWERKFIPRLLEVVYYCFITEEFWELLKVFKSPNVDFRLLKSLCLAKTKELFPEMFKDGVSDFNI